MPGASINGIRPAIPGDAASILDLVRAAYAKWIPVLGREPLPMKADYEKAIREHQIDVLYVDRRMVGLIETLAHPGHLWIENVAVAPENQGHGLGRRLLIHAEQRATRSKCPEVRLLTNGACESNIALYRTLGYAVDRREPFMGGTAVYMSKRLSG